MQRSTLPRPAIGNVSSQATIDLLPVVWHILWLVENTSARFRGAVQRMAGICFGRTSVSEERCMSDMRRSRLTLWAAACVVISALSLAAVVSGVPTPNATDPLQAEPHFEVIAPTAVASGPDGRARFSIRLIPKLITAESVMEIFPSCDCLAAGEPSRIVLPGEDVEFHFVGSGADDSLRTWHVHFRAREQCGNEVTVSREVPVVPSTITIARRVVSRP
jgi:hypothetical protein